MKHITIVTPDIVGPIKNGGIGTACFHYARTLANAGNSVDILFSGPVEKSQALRWRKEYRKLDIGFWTLHDLPVSEMLPYGSTWYTERSWSILQFLRQRSNDLILFQDWHGNGFWSMRAKQLGYAFDRTTLGVIAHSPTEWQNAGMATFGRDPLEEADLAWTEKQAIAEADVLFSPSRHMVAWLREHGYTLPSRIVWAPYTFEDTAAPRLPDPDPDHLLFFGRLETRKGLHLLAAALRALPSNRRPRRVSLLGKYATVNGEPAEQYIERLQAELPEITIRVYTDFDYSQALAFIRDSNGIVVMPSTLDNLPLTVIECITNGLHFIASDVGGIPEMVDVEALFEANATSLRRKIERRAEIRFGTMQHLYSPEKARHNWLSEISCILVPPEEPAQPQTAAPYVSSGPQAGVSVCLPFYKHDRYLKRLISAFLQMDRRDVQMVFVNDGTAPEDCPTFHEMSRELSRFGHVFHTQPNAGPGAARNKAVSLARYDDIIFFDSDNVPFLNLVSALHVALHTSNADIVAAPFVAVPPMLRHPLVEDALFYYRPSGGSLASAMLDNVLGDMCSIWSRRTIERLGGFQTRRFYWEDWEIYIQAIGQSHRLLVYPEPLFFYTQDKNERRNEILDYTNYTELWRRLDRIPSEQLANFARIFIQDAYLRRKQHNV